MVTEKNFPWSHISPSLKVKLLDQINANTFLLNSAGFTSHNINGLNFVQTTLPASEGQADCPPRSHCGNAPVLIFPVTITCSHGPPESCRAAEEPAPTLPWPNIGVF